MCHVTSAVTGNGIFFYASRGVSGYVGVISPILIWVCKAVNSTKVGRNRNQDQSAEYKVASTKILCIAPAVASLH